MSSCLGLVRESYYAIDSSEGERLPRDHPLGPSYSIASRSNEVGCEVFVTDYAPYEVLAGPLVIWVIPLALVSWIWYEPLPEDTVSVRVLFRGPRDALEIRPDEMRLRLADGSEIKPSDAELTEGPRLLLTFSSGEAIDGTLELSLDGIYVDGARQTFAPLSLRKAAGWRVMGIAMDGRILHY